MLYLISPCQPISLLLVCTLVLSPVTGAVKMHVIILSIFIDSVSVIKVFSNIINNSTERGSTIHVSSKGKSFKILVYKSLNKI